MAKKQIRRPHKVEIRELSDGSFHIKHGHKPDDRNPEEEEYTAPDSRHLVQHVAKAFGATAEPDSLEDGGQVEQTGMALVHAGEKVIPAPKKSPKRSVKQDREEIQALRKGRQQVLDAIPEGKRWMADPKNADPRWDRKDPLETFPQNKT